MPELGLGVRLTMGGLILALVGVVVVYHIVLGRARARKNARDQQPPTNKRRAA